MIHHGWKMFHCKKNGISPNMTLLIRSSGGWNNLLRISHGENLFLLSNHGDNLCLRSRHGGHLQIPTKGSKDKHQMGQAFAEIKELRAELAALKIKQGGEPWHGRVSSKQGEEMFGLEIPQKGRENDTSWMENVPLQEKRDFTQYDTAHPQQWWMEQSPSHQSWRESIPPQQPWRQPMPPQPSWRAPTNQEIHRYPYKRQTPPQEGPRYPYRRPEQAEENWDSSRGFSTQSPFPVACPPPL